MKSKQFMAQSELAVTLRSDTSVGFQGEEILKTMAAKDRIRERKYNEAPPSRPGMTVRLSMCSNRRVGLYAICSFTVSHTHTGTFQVDALKKLAVRSGAAEAGAALGTHEALYDFAPSTSGDLALSAGDAITQMEDYGDGWCKGGYYTINPKQSDLLFFLSMDLALSMDLTLSVVSVALLQPSSHPNFLAFSSLRRQLAHTMRRRVSQGLRQSQGSDRD